MLNEELASQAPEDAPLGKFAFPLQRNRKGAQLPEEPDTWEEEQLFDELGDHFSFKNKKISSDTAAMMKGFLERGEYKKVFHEPSSNEIIFRGMKTSLSFIENVATTVGESFDELALTGELEGTFVYTPLFGASSWTLDKDTAEEFRGRWHSGGQNSVIIHARVSDNIKKLVMCRDGIYDVGGLGLYTHEDEVIALGKIKAFKLEYVREEEPSER